MSLFKRIARELVTPELTASEVAQINAWLGDVKGTILDLGCGWGRHAALMVREGRRVIGVDRYQGFVPELQSVGVEPWPIFFHQLNDAKAEEFDAAYSWQNSMFSAPPLDMLENLRGVAGVMRPGGKLLLQNTSRKAAAAPEDVTFKGVRQVTKWNHARGCVDVTFSARDEPDDHVSLYCYTKEQMMMMLDLAGFDFVRWEDNGSDTLTLAKRRDDSGRVGIDEAETVARIANDMMREGLR